MKKEEKIYNARRIFAAFLLILFSTLTLVFLKALHKGVIMPVPSYRSAGAAKAAIEIYEYTDLSCPACTMSNELLHNVLRVYGNVIRLHFKHFPLEYHKWSKKAALYADCAGEQGKFFDYANFLFRNQDKWVGEEQEPKIFTALAENLGLDKDKLNICLNNLANTKRINLEIAEGNAKGLEATPTFFVNGKYARGPHSLIEQLKASGYFAKQTGGLK